MKLNRLPVLATMSLIAACLPAKAGLTIVPTFGSSITSDPNASTIESSIDATIARIESDISNTTTVHITFNETNSGLGDSSTLHFSIPYSTYHSDLQSHATSPDDALALTFLPSGSNNPVDGNTNVNVNTALARALGIQNYNGSDGTIDLNTSIMNLSRTGAQNPNDYDIEAVAGHEIDEVLGIGGPGSSLPTTTGAVGVLDLFRYSAPGVRSFTTSSSATAYFSINGGTTNLVNFNQSGGGADYADWGSTSSPQVQDAFGSPGVDVNVGTNELIALDAVGYTLTPGGLSLADEAVPEPSIGYLLLGGLLVLGVHRRFRKARCLVVGQQDHLPFPATLSQLDHKK